MAVVSVLGVTAMTVAYNGAAFHGFARQPGLETVQGRLESALSIAMGRHIEITGAGRTDAGVHALGQVISFVAAPGDPDPVALRRSVSALAGPEIVVAEIREAREGFSARHDALTREYRYLLVPGSIAPLALRGRAWWTKRSLDLHAIREGAAHLVGEHDFRSFCVRASADGRSTVRGIDLVDVQPADVMGEHCLVVRIVGRSFLHSMVRIMVGSLVEVGRARRDPEWIAEALLAEHRGAAGITAPPHGLTLWHVTYPEEFWL